MSLLRSSIALVAVIILQSGCDKPKQPPVANKSSKIAAKLATGSQAKGTESTAGPRAKQRPLAPATESEFDFSFSGSDEFSFDRVSNETSASHSRDAADSRPGFSTEEIAQRVAALLQDAVGYGPTLAVWILDESPSARRLVNDFAHSIRQPYLALRQDDDKFLTAVCTVGEKVRISAEPSGDPALLPDTLDALPTDQSGKEMLFSAVREAWAKYGHYRTRQGREVLFFLISDEAGNDQELVDDLAAELRGEEVPFYAIGVPAPFGLSAALAPPVEVASDPNCIRQGPESRLSEAIRLGFWGGRHDFHVLDSGFGPFALERLCRATGGRYIAVRPSTSGFSFSGALNSEWPSPGVWQPDLNAMRKYAPDYVTASEYEALLNGNAACRALIEAAKLPPVEFPQLPQTTFTKRNEAQLANDVTRAQQFAAKMEDGVNRLYDTLENGEGARDKLTSPRWQASFDLAMGRAAAAKARVDGYNVMLAELKRGKNFSDDSHTVWELAAAETTESSSSLRKLGESAREYLERAIAQHPGTPWAKLAEQELNTPLGWQWTER